MKYLLCLALFAATTAMAGDWTPVLKGVQNGCDFDSIDEILTKKTSVPKNLKADVVSHTTKGDRFSLEEGMGEFTLNLKNATAFGYPIKKVVYTSIDYGSVTFTMYFNKADFNKLLPQFKYTTGNHSVLAGSNKALIENWHDGKVVSVQEIAKPKSIEQVGEGILIVHQNGRKQVLKENYDGEKFSSVITGMPNGWELYYPYGADDSGYLGLKADSKKQTVMCTTQ